MRLCGVGSYGADYVESLGYVPCMRAEDITPDNFSFSSMKDYLILCIDTEKVNAVIKREIIAPNEFESENIYGTIPVDAVSTSLPYTFDSSDMFTMSNEVRDITIINEILDKLHIQYASHKYFNDGTSTRIILLNDEYIVRQNKPEWLKNEVQLLKDCNSQKLQHIIFADPDYRYIVCNYVSGEVMHTVDDFDNLIENIKEIVSSYSSYSDDGYGYTYDLHDTWGDFLKSMVNEYSLSLPESFNYLEKVYDAIAVLEKYPFEKKIIHGDFGTHNFIKKDGKFVGAIDPIPIIGDPLYDIAYALMSNVDLLPHVNSDFVANTFNVPLEKAKAMLTVVLFCRFSICLKHHKEDIDAYLDFWFKEVENE